MRRSVEIDGGDGGVSAARLVEGLAVPDTVSHSTQAHTRPHTLHLTLDAGGAFDTRSEKAKIDLLSKTADSRERSRLFVTKVVELRLSPASPSVLELSNAPHCFTGTCMHAYMHMHACMQVCAGALECTPLLHKRRGLV